MSSNNAGAYISFMFDDGRSSIYDIVFPFFEDNKILGSIGLVGSYVGKKGYLTLDQLKELIKKGWSLGDHTFTHPNMNDISLEHLSKEIRLNRLYAEQKLGYKLYYFIFPKSRMKKYHLSFILRNYNYVFTGRSETVANSPPFRGLLTRTQITLYDVIRFSISGRCFLKELIRKISLAKNSNNRYWFIFFTHDVNKCPGLFDIFQGYFLKFVKLLIEMEIPILPVDSLLSGGV